jgi:hypothetical protein
MLAAEVVARRLVAAVPALEELCRRFKGFGRLHPVREQLTALDALAPSEAHLPALLSSA